VCVCVSYSWNHQIQQQFRGWMESFCRGHIINLPFQVPTGLPRSAIELAELESLSLAIDLYLWLSFRFPDIFVDYDRAAQLREEVCTTMAESLEMMSEMSVRPTRRRFAPQHNQSIGTESQGLSQPRPHASHGDQSQSRSQLNHQWSDRKVALPRQN
jgi:hypothetical protein